MTLKFQNVQIEETPAGHVLMYVEFEHKGNILRWYPKWKDIAELLRNTFATEDGFNSKKLTPYLTIVCLEMLIRQQLRELKTPHDFDILSFNTVIDQLEQLLLKGL